MSNLNDIGKPLFWHLADHVRAVEQMIRADELQIALRMCDDIPGWYRDNYPKELADIKRKLYERTYSTTEYGTDDEEAEMTREIGEAQWVSEYCYPRAQVLENIIKGSEAVPWVFDLGASHGNCPVGLLSRGLLFQYKGIGINWRIIQKVKEWAKNVWAEKPTVGQPTILFCTEVLEHCQNPQDIVHEAYKVGVEWDWIVISTPKYTLGGGLEDWNRRLGHVRTWTPSELFEFCNKNWRGYKWEILPEFSMVIVGRR